MTPDIQTLFNRLQNGVAIISAEGRVRYANEALMDTMPVGIGYPFPHEPVKKAVEQVINGYLPVPHSMKTELYSHIGGTGTRHFSVHLVASPLPTEIIVVMVDETASIQYQTSVTNALMLTERLLLTPASSLAKALQRLLDDASVLGSLPAVVQAQHKRVISEAKAFCRQLTTLARLAQQSTHQPIRTQDRIKLSDWLPELLARHQSQAQAKGQHIELERLTASCQPVTIYGSEHWLGIAMSICIENAINQSAHNVDLAITCQHTHAYVRITAHNHGRQHRQRGMPELLKPATRRNEAKTHQTALSEIDLPLARAIIELHRGHLSLRQDLDGFIGFTIELPTGANEQLDTALDIIQSQRFANDLARLLRTRKACVAPHEEAA